MILFKNIAPLQHRLQKMYNQKSVIGFVPTMGALHAGHLSLIAESRKQCNITVCSIFINPVQFNDQKDFEKYPATLESDILMLEQAKTDILFLPYLNEIYPQGINRIKDYDLGYYENILEGYYRPKHFQGVCNVVERLLEIIKPNVIFLGQKDYQQCMVIKKMLNDHEFKIKVDVVNTFRETDGLAMSSRNMRLSKAARIKAAAIYKALNFICENINNKPFDVLKNQATGFILNSGFEKVDYVEIADAETLLPVKEINNKINMIALVAAYIEGVRLIDNLVL